MVAMKMPPRCSFTVLIFVVLVSAVSFSTMLPRAVVLRRAVVPQHAVVAVPTWEKLSHNPARLNTTLLRLAAFDPEEARLRQKVQAVLEGRLASADIGAGRNPIEPSVLSRLRTWHDLNHYDPSVLGQLTSLLSIPERIPSCAVVGNSGILLRANHGAHIDSHTAVFRLNNANISGHAAHVGSKTNFSFIHRFILRHCAQPPICFCHPYGPGVRILVYASHPSHFIHVVACNATSSSRHEPHISVIDPRHNVLCERIVKYYSLRRFVDETGRAPEEWHRKHDALRFHYSSGMQGIMVAVGVCERVSVFGFGKSSDAKHHYHDDRRKEVSKHDFEAEYAFYHDLSEHPQAVPFLNDSGFAIPPVIFYH